MNSPQVNWTLVKTDDGQSWRGVLTLPTMPGGQEPEPGAPKKVLKVTGKKAGSKEKALKNVANSALKALENPSVQAVLPPGAGLALDAVKALANPKALRAVAKHGKKALRIIGRAFS